ncbi:MAG: DsbA family oxidoreductase [Acidimicrobiales bacterium]
MLVEIWSDVVCPWCYIGKRHFEEALGAFPHQSEVTVEWRSFELDPKAPSRREVTTIELLEKKYGLSVSEAAAATARVAGVATGAGLDFRWEQAVSGNTFDAHRLIHLGASEGRGDVTNEALLAAYFTRGMAIGERATLDLVAGEVGLDRDRVAAMLDGVEFADEVRADERRATGLGIGAVPFFLIDREYGISGAQTSDILLEAMEQAWSRSRRLTIVSEDGSGVPVRQRR